MKSSTFDDTSFRAVQSFLGAHKIGRKLEPQTSLYVASHLWVGFSEEFVRDYSTFSAHPVVLDVRETAETTTRCYPFIIGSGISTFLTFHLHRPTVVRLKSYLRQHHFRSPRVRRYDGIRNSWWADSAA
jgi:hypothetical protein